MEKGLSSATEKEGMKQRDTKITNRKNIFRIAICHSKSVIVLVNCDRKILTIISADTNHYRRH